MAAQHVDTAMVLAAGLGQRMRPLTDTRPKPLISFCGKPLIDHVLDRLADAGIKRTVVNAHYFADMIFAHVATRQRPPDIVLSDERDQLLDTGGGVVHALEHFRDAPFITHNSDSVWTDGADVCNLQRLIEHWDPATMDCLMLLAEPQNAIGYGGQGDFVLEPSDGRLRRRTTDDTNALVFAGVSVAHPRLFADAPAGPFSMNVVWDQAIAKRRVFGIALDGIWMHIGTPDALTTAEKWIADGAANRS